MSAQPQRVTVFLVQLRTTTLNTPSTWLGRSPAGFYRWTNKLAFAAKFNTFAEADDSSKGYDVIIKGVEVSE